ncbi:MAG: PAS domain S-box protein [Bacteroidales bacterium]|nr:PAS domain S-box protein [Bacteroidales bacterium]
MNCSTVILNIFLPASDYKRFRQSLSLCLRTRTEQLFEYNLKINGIKQYFEAKFVYLQTNKVLAIARNITNRRNSEELLLQSEALYKKLVETSPDAVVICTTDFRILFVSQKAVQMFDCESRTDLLGTRVFRWIGKDYRTPAQNILFKSLREQENIFNQVKLVRKRGSSFMGEISGTSIRSKNGNLWGYMLIVRDITLRLHINHQVKLLYSAIEQSPVSFIITDTQGKIEYVNQTFTNYTGYRPDEVIGKTPALLKSGKQPDKIYKDLWNTLNSGKEWKGELINKRKDDSYYWESAVIAPVKNNEGAITHFIAVKEDISDRKAFEKELIDAKNKAEESDRLKSAFLANISHEIRTPMNGILGFANLLQEELKNNEKVNRYAQIIVNGCNKLLSIMTDIVDISKIEADSVEISKTSISLNTLLTDIVEKLSDYAATKGIVLRVLNDGNEKVVLFTDSIKLMQVITHLLQNAIKFSSHNTVDIGYQIEDNEISFLSGIRE